MTPFEAIWRYWPAFAAGLGVTFQLTAIAIILGALLGIGLATLFRARLGRTVLNSAALVVAAVPALVVLFWLYYPAQTLLDVSWSPFVTAAIALTLMNAFAVYRIVNDAIVEFPRQYITSALVCGLSSSEIAWRIQAPLLVRTAAGRWLDQQVVVLQTSVFASLIGVDEVFRAAQRINSVTYQPVVIYSAMAFVFVLATAPLILVARRLKARFQRDFSER